MKLGMPILFEYETIEEYAERVLKNKPEKRKK